MSLFCTRFACTLFYPQCIFSTKPNIPPSPFLHWMYAILCNSHAHKCALFRYSHSIFEQKKKHTTSLHCLKSKKKHSHEMFTIQIFCSYSINYKSFSLSATKTMWTIFFLVELHNEENEYTYYHNLSDDFQQFRILPLLFFTVSCLYTRQSGRPLLCIIINHN